MIGLHYFSLGSVINMDDIDTDANIGDILIIKNEEGKLEYGEIVYKKPGSVDKNDVKIEFIRLASAGDMKKISEQKKQSIHDIETAQQYASELKLSMIFQDAFYSFDGKKISLIFMSEGRVDFRELLKNLIGTFRKTVVFRQIGPRDRAQLIGGYGKCGRDLCCRGNMSKFESININMAKSQGLADKGTARISGLCGKLMCCLKYEDGNYVSALKKFPKIGEMVMHLKDKRQGRVIGIEPLNSKLKLLFSDPETHRKTVKNVLLDDIKWKK